VHCFHQFHTQTQKGIVPAVVCQFVGEDDFPVAFRPVVPTDRNENRFPENPCGDRAEESFESADGNPFDGFEMDRLFPPTRDKESRKQDFPKGENESNSPNGGCKRELYELLSVS